MIAFLEHGLVRLAVSISRLLILPPPPTTRVCNWEENLGYAHRCITLADARWALVCEMAKNFQYSSLTPYEKKISVFFLDARGKNPWRVFPMQATCSPRFSHRCMRPVNWQLSSHIFLSQQWPYNYFVIPARDI